MEMILISDSKLKIMLTSDDMEEIDLKIADFDTSGNAFAEILSQARTQTGFEASADRIFVQVYPLRTGGCEVYVTKIEIPSAETVRLVRPDTVKGTHRRKKYKCVFHFESMEALLQACRRTCEKVDSSAYSSATGYYLVMSWEETSSNAHAESLIATLKFGAAAEHGSLVKTEPVFAYISEHGTPICLHTAAATLGALV